jgi:hypothetical protein
MDRDKKVFGHSGSAKMRKWDTLFGLGGGLTIV